MSELSPDSFDLKSCGKQADSVKRNSPLWKLGSETRDQAKQVFISVSHTQDTVGRSSPGPIYRPPPINNLPKWKFGTGPSRSVHVGGLREKVGEARYPETSGDLIRAHHDSQKLKFRSPQKVNFGTENRDAAKNQPGLETYPLGKSSPGPQTYDVEGFWLEGPRYSCAPRSKLPETICQTPERVAPGSYPIPPAVGAQPSSVKPSLPQWSFSKSERFKTTSDRTKSGSTHDALGNAALKFHRMNSFPSYGFGTSTREHKKKLTPNYTPADAGPKGEMPQGLVKVPSLPARKEQLRFMLP